VRGRQRRRHQDRQRVGPTVTVGALSNGLAQQTDLKVSEVKSISAELPKSVTKSGKPTLTGAEPDFGRLVAAVLGLKAEVKNSTWENLFVGIDSGKVDAAFSNVTDTEERKKKYEFASYRQDNLAFAVLKSSTWNFNDDYENLAGKTVAVDNGTNQEKILLEWQAKLKKEGKKLTVKRFPDANSTYLALAGKKIDAYFTPNPGLSYHPLPHGRLPVHRPRRPRRSPCLGRLGRAGRTRQRHPGHRGSERARRRGDRAERPGRPVDRHRAVRRTRIRSGTARTRRRTRDPRPGRPDEAGTLPAPYRRTRAPTSASGTADG